MLQDRPSTTRSADRTRASGEVTREASQAELAASTSAIRGIGIGIESVTSFPEAENYLEHEFYQARFTPAELASCAGQASPRTSFCTLAAVKRAVAKAGVMSEAAERLAAIEITYDESGRPTYPDCFVSVDLSESAVVAVCLWARAQAEPAAPAPMRPGRPLGSYSPLQRLGIRLLMGSTALGLLFVFGAGVWFILSEISR